MNATVAIVRCSDYDPGRIAGAMAEIFGLLGGPGQLIPASAAVLIKPNVMGAFAPDSGIVTHPAVVGGLIAVARAAGADVSVGDSPAGVTDSATLARVWEESGYDALVRETGVRRAVFESAVVMRRPSADVGIDSHCLAADVLAADLIINAPKLKTHRLMRYTGAIKNLMGIIPGSRKAHIHRLNPAPEFVAGIITDIWTIVRPRLTVLDAVDVIEGDGPGATGVRRRLGLLLAGTDPVAVDATACRIVGIDPLSVPTTVAAVNRGIGLADADRIDVVGTAIDSAAVTDFRPAPRGRWDTGSAFVHRFWELARTQVTIDHDCCRRCGACVAACPVGAISCDPPHIAEAGCIECYCCHEICPAAAVIISPKHQRI